MCTIFVNFRDLNFKQGAEIQKKQGGSGDSIDYIIVKDSSMDLGVNSKIVQIRPILKAVSTKISKTFFCIFVNILIFLRENNEASFFLFWVFKLKQPYAKP